MSEAKYLNKKEIRYYSVRYNKWIIVEEYYPSDGATFAVDIYSDGWWVHDKVTDTGLFEDGSRCTNWQASMILSDILKSEGRWARQRYWFVATFLFGGGECRKNGMFKLKEINDTENWIKTIKD